MPMNAIASRLTDTALWKQLKSKSETDDAVRRLLVVVEDAFNDAVEITKLVLRFMSEYTLHDEVHLVRVVDLMGRLIPEQTFAILNPLELAALILAAAFHDIGMSPSGDEVRKLLSAKQDTVDLDSDAKDYLTLKYSMPHLIERQQLLRKKEENHAANEIESYFLVEYLRRTHAERGRRLVHEKFAEVFRYENYRFAARLADVCFSHNEDPAYLTRLPCWELVRAPGEYCNWRFVAAVLRIADILDFDPKRTPQVLFEHIGVRNSISIREWKKHLAIAAWDIRSGRIAFSAQCNDPAIEKTIRDFARMMDNELIGVRTLLQEMHHPAEANLASRYRLDLPPGVDMRDIQPTTDNRGMPTYRYVDIGFKLDDESVASLLMGINLYKSKTLFLREILQNSVDACRHRLAMHQQAPAHGPYEPRIIIKLARDSDERDWIEIEDNGMGMDERIVKNFFARIGKSYYRSGDFLQDRTRLGLAFKPVSQFGIGVLSVFMACDLLHVETRSFFENSQSLNIEIGHRGSLFWFRQGDRRVPGTKIRLRLASDPEELWLAEDARFSDKKFRKDDPAATLHSTIQKLLMHIDIPVYVESCGVGMPIANRWTLPKYSLSRDADGCYETVDIEFDKSSRGVRGRARIVLLGSKKSGFQKKVILPASPDEYDEYFTDHHSDEDLRDTLTHEDGYIDHTNVDFSAKSGRHESYSIFASAMGRWSQQGFVVDCGLFRARDLWSRTSGNDAQVAFPFPIYYDLDVEEEFVLPLSIDRNSILPTPDAAVVARNFVLLVSRAMFKVLGVKVVKKNEAFFREIAEDSTEGDALVHALEEFLRQSRAAN